MADGSSLMPPSSLRVALISTCAHETPPREAGEVELFVSELARELANLGHQPTVFATGDSTCAGARRCLFDAAVAPPDELADLRHASAAWQQIAREHFDVVHVSDPSALPFSRFVPIPTVATIHHRRVDAVAHHYVSFPDVSFVAVSERQAGLSPDVPIRAVIHHGLDIDRYPFGEGGPHVVFTGRATADRGVHLALEAARRVGVPLTLASDVGRNDRAMLEASVDASTRSRLHWQTNLGHYRRVELLRHAQALLFPIQREEPFGMAMIEAMLVGTPVIALARGSAPEVVEEGVTGFLVDNVDELTLRIRDVRMLDRRRCRERARERWNSARMARDYVEVYRDVVERWALDGAPSSRRAPRWATELALAGPSSTARVS